MFEMAPHVIIFDGKQGEGIRYQGSILKLKSISSLCLPPSDVAYFQTLGDDDSFLPCSCFSSFPLHKVKLVKTKLALLLCLFAFV